MKLTRDERAFIARWLLEFGEEPVSLERRFAADWLRDAGAYTKMDHLWSNGVLVGNDGSYGEIHTEHRRAFKGDDHD